jgi:hypothetical protein
MVMLGHLPTQSIAQKYVHIDKIKKYQYFWKWTIDQHPEEK